MTVGVGLQLANTALGRYIQTIISAITATYRRILTGQRGQTMTNDAAERCGISLDDADQSLNTDGRTVTLTWNPAATTRPVFRMVFEPRYDGGYDRREERYDVTDGVWRPVGTDVVDSLDIDISVD